MRDSDEAFRIDDIDRLVTPDDPYLLRDDSFIDPVAINVAINGYRKVALTHREREICALVIRYRCRQDCADSNRHPRRGEVAKLIQENLSLPSFEAAVSLVRSLPDGERARKTTEYWSGDTSKKNRRDKKNRQRREAYQLRKAS